MPAVPEVRRAALALGSNIGDSAGTLKGAVDALYATPGIKVVAVSAVFETDPVGGPDQDVFLNAVIMVETSLEPIALLDAAQSIELDFGRVRDVRWGPRTLDIDVLAVADLVMEHERLELPHPRAHERAFVLVPWADVDPAGVIPGRGTVADLLASVGDAGVRRTAHALAATSDITP
ncbi:MAG: 2-amino-4-hydroxy-6-hydroxymethyldihydropteridine diphosphokinase [Candidatus Nanopelagicales bacterium]